MACLDPVEAFYAVLLDHDEDHVVLHVDGEQRVLPRSACSLSPFVAYQMPIAVQVEVSEGGAYTIRRT